MTGVEEEGEREFLDYRNADDFRDDVSAHQEKRDDVLLQPHYQLLQLVDIRPAAGSVYLRSVTELFNDEMELKGESVKRWLVHFGLLANEEDWQQSHVSGHGSGDQIKRIIEGMEAKTLVPIHTESVGSTTGNGMIM